MFMLLALTHDEKRIWIPSAAKRHKILALTAFYCFIDILRIVLYSATYAVKMPNLAVIQTQCVESY